MKNIEVQRLPDKAHEGDLAVQPIGNMSRIMIYCIKKGQGQWIEHSRHFLSVGKLRQVLATGQIDLIAKESKH